jgi:hypothetical protein
MVVSVPIAGSDVNLYVSGPDLSVYAHFGVEEVGAGAGVKRTGVNDVNVSAVRCRHSEVRPQAKTPHILHQVFHAERKIK